MILRRTRIRRSAPPRKKRPGPPRRGQPSPAEKIAARDFIYELSGGQCELTFNGVKADRCRRGILPPNGDVRERWHLVHDGAKRRFGWSTTGPRRMRGGCYHCHIELMHQKGWKPDAPLLH